MELPINFVACPVCGDGETCARLACQEIDVPEGVTVAFAQEIIFLKPPQLATVSVPALIAYYDVCANCGTRYCVKVEKRNVPVQHRPASGQFPQPPGNGPGLRGM